MASIKVEDLDEQVPSTGSAQTIEPTNIESEVDTSIIEVKKGPSKLLIGFVLIVLIALGAGLALSLKDRSHLKSEVNKLADQSQTAPGDEAKQLNTAVSQLVELPTDETPSIATVADATKLKQQSSGFENAQNGDKLLIYTRAKQIIVYRPTSKKVVSIVQITVGQAAPTTGTTQKKQ